ncbi:MAG: Ldh family oxidoreductase [Inquilinaceae bacterium]
MPARHDAQDLIQFASTLLQGAGLDAEKAGVTATLLVEADLMGHTTHGLQLCAPYLAAIENGTMETRGDPSVIADRGGVLTWDGRRLPGLWLTARAIDTALDRVADHGTVTVAIRRSHHIGCLAAFLPRATDRGCMAIVTCSDPAGASVAPFGGRRAVFTPDPIAVGIPTDGDPILIDTSASITTNGLTGRLHKEGRRLPGPWVMDADGNAGDDPSVLFTDPPGTILPIGGQDYGHKGYALALMVEALSQGLSGYGRADGPTEWGAAVFVQILDPAAFGGLSAFTRQTGWIAEACRQSPPVPGVESVRLPGHGALTAKRRALAEGVALYPGILDALRPWADKLGVAGPTARS